MGRQNNIIGKPIPIEQLLVYRTMTHEQWLELLKAIPKGFAQEVKFSRGACRRHMKKHEEFGEIEKNEFKVIERTDPTDPKKKKVFIARIK